MVLLFNSLTRARLDSIRSSSGDDAPGQVAIEGLGFTLVDQASLKKAVSAAMGFPLDCTEEGGEGGFTISNKYYTIQLRRDGSIPSWKEKRTKNFERELCKPGD